MKAYTDLSQSKKLAKILPIESADMYYFRQIDNDYIPPDVEFIRPIPFCKDNKVNFKYDIPCWSLAALLGIIPKHIKEFNRLRIDISDNDFAIWYDEIGYGVFKITKESPVDACYEMILGLKERNLL